MSSTEIFTRLSKFTSFASILSYIYIRDAPDIRPIQKPDTGTGYPVWPDTGYLAQPAVFLTYNW